MAANPNRGQGSHAPTRSDGLIQQAQDKLVDTQGKLIEAVMTMQEPMTDALRKTFAMAGNVMSTGQRVAPFDKLLEIQFDLVHKLLDMQVGLVKMVFEAQSDLVKTTQRALQNDAGSSAPATASTKIDLRGSPDEHPAVATTTQ
jgi:hypothetical protein